MFPYLVWTKEVCKTTLCGPSAYVARGKIHRLVAGKGSCVSTYPDCLRETSADVHC